MPPHLNDEKRKTDLAPDWDDDQRLHKRLSNALMRIRDVYGLTSRELAERIDVTESYMSQVLNCRRDVRLSMLNRISKEFGIKSSGRARPAPNRTRSLPAGACVRHDLSRSRKLILAGPSDQPSKETASSSNRPIRCRAAGRVNSDHNSFQGCWAERRRRSASG